MPTLLPSQPSSSSRSYAPLADELNPPFGSHGHLAKQNGSIVYGQRASSLDEQPYRSESQETLSSRTLGWKGKSRVMPSYASDDEADIGELRRGGTTTVSTPKGKGKGKERAWDEEMGGDQVEHDEDGASNAGSYPPVNEAEEEERRIQENLAKFAARDKARRQAAREARQTHPSPGTRSPIQSSSASTTSPSSSFMRRPFTMLSSITSSSSDGRRGSLMGMVGGMMGRGTTAGNQDTELPLASPIRTTFHNPYEPTSPIAFNPNNTNPANNGRVLASPISSTQSPFSDPRISPVPSDDLGSGSTTSPSPLHSPVDGDGYTYGYAGAQWHGGAGSGAAPTAHTPRRDKWWQALYLWGSDLDGGDAQDSGRTNPFE